MTAAPDPIQAQLIAARRNQILDAAATVFAAKGFHVTTIKDIAREAGIADGTIYHYFESKSALLLALFDRMREAALRDADMAALDPSDIRSFLRAYISQPLMALKGNDFALFRIIISEVMVNSDLREQYYTRMLEPTLALAEPIFGQWAAEGRIAAPDLQLALRAISGMLLGLIFEYIMGDQTLAARWDALPDALTDLILNGLRSDQP